MYSSEIHFPLFHLSDYPLSSVWSTFTRCKSDMRDGFRLENLSWRLWYRQCVLQKPNRVHLNLAVPQPTLRRSCSMPKLTVHSPPKRARKFFIEEIPVKKPNLRRITTSPQPLSERMPKPAADTKASGLRRCQSRYTRLDQLFLNAH
ncbi:hypothetical protein BY458DRAFT_495528 [Sporodiniella umbellata]|nr:hypothetical protein BY458DRAFT_495528 [Sporodiniella umbellata]